MASSILAYSEGRAALASARRGERLTPTGYRKALEDFENTLSELLVIAIDDRLATHAGQPPMSCACVDTTPSISQARWHSAPKPQ